jgi:hypothetical protein
VSGSGGAHSWWSDRAGASRHVATAVCLSPRYLEGNRESEAERLRWCSSPSSRVLGKAVQRPRGDGTVMRYSLQRWEVEDNADRQAPPIGEKGRGKEGLLLGRLVGLRPQPSSGRERGERRGSPSSLFYFPFPFLFPRFHILGV